MNIELNNTYFILSSPTHSFSLGENEYNSLKLCVCKHYIINGNSITYHFYPVCVDDDSDEFYSICDTELSFLVFETKDAFFRYLLTYIDILNCVEFRIAESMNLQEQKSYELDDFIKQKITESREKNPEKWI